MVVKLSPSSYSVGNEDLFKMGFVVEDDEDLSMYKYMYYGQMFNSKTIDLVIATSLGCNLNCPYCFEGNNKSSLGIDDNTIKSILEYIIKHKAKPVNITWFGGEPMLKYDAICRISEVLNAESILYKSLLITNGTIFPDEFLLKIDEYRINSIQITIDGLKETHDSKRHYKNGKGTFVKILTNVGKILEKTKAEIVLKMNVDSSNIEEFSKLKHYLKESFSEYIGQGRVLITTNYIRKKNDFKGIEKCISCLEYFDFELENGKKMSMPGIIGPCPLRSRGYWVIGPDGALYKCMEHLGDAKHVIGNINDFIFSIKKESASCFKNLPFDDAVCVACKILPICGGGCPNERANIVGEERPCPAEKYRINDIVSKLYE